jgi:hypothetical protein
MERARKRTRRVATDPRIVYQCVAALEEAYRRALAQGLPLVVSDELPGGGRAIFEVAADGTRRRLKDIASPVSVPVGTRLRIR